MKKTQNVYKQPQPVPVPEGNGYPNNVASTQTKKARGTGKATRGTGFSGKSN